MLNFMASLLTIPPLERLAQRICRMANTEGTVDATAVVVLFRKRLNRTIVDPAVGLAIEDQWLRFDGTTYTLDRVGIGGAVRFDG